VVTPRQHLRALHLGKGFVAVRDRDGDRCHTD
jgi:hypothetical protein